MSFDGGGKRLPNSAYSVNNGYVADSTTTIAEEGTVITYIARNDGTTPPFVASFGFGQEQIDKEPSSIIGNNVIIKPGPGAEKTKPISFEFTSVSNEDLEIYQPLTGDGPLNENEWLIPNGVQPDDGVTIQFVGRDAAGPPTWYIRIGPKWYSSYTTIETTRVTLTIQLTKKINSVVVAGKALGSGAKMYKYSEKVGHLKYFK